MGGFWSAPTVRFCLLWSADSACLPGFLPGSACICHILHWNFWVGLVLWVCCCSACLPATRCCVLDSACLPATWVLGLVWTCLHWNLEEQILFCNSFLLLHHLPALGFSLRSGCLGAWSATAFLVPPSLPAVSACLLPFCLRFHICSFCIPAGFYCVLTCTTAVLSPATCSCVGLVLDARMPFWVPAACSCGSQRKCALRGLCGHGHNAVSRAAFGAQRRMPP